MADQNQSSFGKNRQKHYRNEILYRFLDLPAGDRLNVGCGYMLKPTQAGAYRDRVQASLVAVVVLRGQGIATDWHGRPHRVQAGDMIVMPPGLRHSVVQDANGQWAEFYLNCHASFHQAMRLLQVLPEDGFVYRTGFRPLMLNRFDEIFETIRRLTPADWPGMWAQCHALLAELLRLDRQSQQAVSPLKRQMIEAANLLADHSERRISLPALAQKLGMSYESFRKHFRQEMGMSPGELRIRRRMELAQKLISEHRLSSKEVAYRLGYADPFTFSKQFRRYTGQSPREFQRQVQPML